MAATNPAVRDYFHYNQQPAASAAYQDLESALNEMVREDVATTRLSQWTQMVHAVRNSAGTVRPDDKMKEAIQARFWYAVGKPRAKESINYNKDLDISYEEYVDDLRQKWYDVTPYQEALAGAMSEWARLINSVVDDWINAQFSQAVLEGNAQRAEQLAQHLNRK